MTQPVKRRYDSGRRRQAAAQTRRDILDAAAFLFGRDGYAATTMSEIARRAGVALDTVYASAGPKPALFRLLIETAISGTDQEVPVLERGYIAAIRSEPEAAGKLRAYAAAITAIQQRLAPLYQAVTSAAGLPEAGAIWDDLLARRARNMPLLIEELARTGALRPDLDASAAADDVWVLNSTEVYVLLTRARGWTPDRYREWLGARLVTLLLSPPAGPPAASA